MKLRTILSLDVTSSCADQPSDAGIAASAGTIAIVDHPDADQRRFRVAALVRAVLRADRKPIQPGHAKVSLSMAGSLRTFIVVESKMPDGRAALVVVTAIEWALGYGVIDFDVQSELVTRAMA